MGGSGDDESSALWAGDQRPLSNETPTAPLAPLRNSRRSILDLLMMFPDLATSMTEGYSSYRSAQYG